MGLLRWFLGPSKEEKWNKVRKVLIVDDSPQDLDSTRGIVEREGYRVAVASNGREALDIIAKNRPDFVLTALEMPVMNGLELVRRVRRRFPNIPVILMTEHGSEEMAVEALHAGAANYVPKKNLRRHLGETLRHVIVAASYRHPSIATPNRA